MTFDGNVEHPHADRLGHWTGMHTPADMSDIRLTQNGFTTEVTFPTDDVGFFGRECPSCHNYFKIHEDDYEALPDGAITWCPGCGHSADSDVFLTDDQARRLEAAVNGAAEQYVHAQVSDMFRHLQRKTSSSLKVTVSARPTIRPLPDIVEKLSRRKFNCPDCRKTFVVYHSPAFCVFSGRLETTSSVLEAVSVARESLAMEDRIMDADQREDLRAAGVFDATARSIVEQFASHFESLFRRAFSTRVPEAESLIPAGGNPFQRAEFVESAMRADVGIDLPRELGVDTWERICLTIAKRHVLIHNGGIVDAKFLKTVSISQYEIGERLMITRQDADAALTDLERLVSILRMRGRSSATRSEPK